MASAGEFDLILLGASLIEFVQYSQVNYSSIYNGSNFGPISTQAVCSAMGKGIHANEDTKHGHWRGLRPECAVASGKRGFGQNQDKSR